MNIKLTIPEFSKLYRDYANEVKEGKRQAVDRSAWKRMKGLIINNKRLTEVIVYLDGIHLCTIDDHWAFDEATIPSLCGFLDFIYQKHKEMNTLGDLVTAAETKCNCADANNSYWTNSTGTYNICINDNIDTNKTIDWNPIGTISLTDNYSTLENKLKEQNDKHDKDIADLAAQSVNNAQNIDELYIRVNDARNELDDTKVELRRHEHSLKDCTEDIGRIVWMVGNTDNAVQQLIDDTVNIQSQILDLKNTIAEHLNTKNTDTDDNNKENNFMDMKFMNFDFGKVNSDAIRMSMYGLAIKNVNGIYVSYDAKTHSMMDVEIMNVPGGDLFYKMPVAIKDVKAGDIVIHNKVPMFVVEVHTSTIKVIDVREGTEKEIYLTKNMFGFNYATKVVSLMDMMGGNMKPTTDNPFGNIGMLMLMSGDNDMKDILPMLMLSGNTNFASNPMLMYFMMKDGGKMDDMLPLMLLMNQPTATEQKM